MNKILRKTIHPASSLYRGVFTTMALMLLMGGLISPLAPMVAEATINNVATANAAAAQPLDPVEPVPAVPVEQVEPVEPVVLPPVLIAQPIDTDNDGIPDPSDSCPTVPNIGKDWDQDGIDDACDPRIPDGDNDGYPDDQDSCPNDVNLGTDWDGDRVDDACDPAPVDTDSDGLTDDEDSCPDVPNLGTDWNADGIDDACDPPPADRDGDTIPDGEDSCPDNPNLGLDWNANGIDDACDPPPSDRDGDGITDGDDSCPDNPNLGLDWNGDGLDDACDPAPDADNDGYVDFEDSCPNDYNLDTDWDSDGMDDACDPPMVPQDEPSDFEEYLMVEVKWCPIGTDLTSYPANSDGPVTECSEPGFNSTVVLESSTNPANNMSQPVTPVPGYAEFRPVPVDTWQIHVEPSIEITSESLHCASFSEFGNTKPYARVQFALTSEPESYELYDWETLDGEYTYCYWYGVAVPNGDLRVMKYECPAAQPADSTVEQYLDACTVPMNDVPFTLDKPDPMTDVMASSNETGTPGGLEMTGIEEGTYKLTEGPFAGYESLAVFCSVPKLPEETAAPADFSESTLAENSIDVTIAADNVVTCYWFNGPDDGEGQSLTIYKWECPAGTMYGQAEDYYSTECATQQAGVPFDIHDDNGTQSTTSEIDGRQIDNLEGEIVILEFVPEGYGSPVVFCKLLNDDSGTLYELEQGVVTLPAATDDDYQCWFYNIPTEGTGDVLVYKYECPSAAPADAMDDWYYTNCNTPMDGVQFNLLTPDLNIQTNTGDSIPGAVMFGDVDAGTYPLTETPPDGYKTLAVHCVTVEDGTIAAESAFVPVPLTGDTIDATVTANHSFICNWYNVADDDPSVTIYKWECPDGTMLGQVESYYSAECATQQPGVPFTVTDDNGTQDTTSDTDGRQIDGLVGDVTITEVVPAGFGNPVIFCKLLNDDAGTDYSSSSPSVTLPANADDDYQCWFYNIPDDEPTLTINKYECPETVVDNLQLLSVYQTECVTEQPGVTFEVSDASGTQNVVSALGGVQVSGLTGIVSVDEIIPPGYGTPAAFCQSTEAEGPVSQQLGGPYASVEMSGQEDAFCWFYNIPEDPSKVVIYKWRCPDGMPAEMTQTWFQTNCTTPMDDVPFSLTDSMGPKPDKTTVGGTVEWVDVATGAVQITEHVPAGFDPHPFVVCEITAPNMPPTTVTPATVNGTWNTTITLAGTTITCHWFNWYQGPGEITVYKFTCPPGYDRTAWGADPMVDCTEATNGIEFVLDQPEPNPDLSSMTGDSINGAVYFGGLAPGDYTLTEKLGIHQMMVDVFVWQCVGLNSSAVHPIPLSVGPGLNFKITAGDKIVCYWFNVPYPEDGQLVVHKYNCTTETYVSDVYCYTNQTGQEFNLQKWDGANWVTVMSGTTDVSGKVTFNNLDAGDYKLVEPNKQACLMKSSNITAGGNIGVNQGEGTTVYVYNCQTPPPPQTGKTPTKYPNTGVAPAAEQGEQRTPAIELAGLLTLAGLHLNRRRLLKGATVLAAGSTTAWSFGQAQELVPLDSTPAPGTPDAAALGCATPEASTPMADGTPTASGTPMIDPCNRGAIPIQIRVPKIEVDAAIEYLEIIDGEMQAPSGATDVTWYKETSRLGEVGNGIYAGHLNYWGVPEGVFFRLESLAEGDIIEIDGDDQQTYLFQVQWMQNFPSDEEPPAEALGFTEEPVITLITCGGEWVPDRSEYDHRTLVRAVLWEP